MKLIIHAANIHKGGGRVLLLSIISALKEPATVFVDKRFGPLPDLNPLVSLVEVSPNIVSRLVAEFKLRKLSQADHILLCFGNLPPLFPNRARVFVYLQNRYLSMPRTLKGLSIKAQLRIRMERCWLRSCLRGARILVQTETMAEEVRGYLGVNGEVLPFLPRSSQQISSILENDESKAIWQEADRYDYLYVASGETHKNHERLIMAWVFLARKNFFPSLCLTLDQNSDAKLLAWVRAQASEYGLNIVNRPLPPNQIPSLYRKSKSLIYPSLFESFGLPLLEARALGLPIIAAERDYVRDVVLPADSFDPLSALSIARAVLRRHALAQVPPMPSDTIAFLQELERLE
ncbi:MAG: glycosyltransferase [Thalassospira sp.]|uniref:glycosyltransferase n=1 Tax=Thalassospira sp. TaxID=1912094 RepID=UPI000C358C2C|nr:glycosyltransferase [Thalassospira sp.]MAZ35623.1 glycosyltransferase [Thalassospira sp.]